VLLAGCNLDIFNTKMQICYCSHLNKPIILSHIKFLNTSLKKLKLHHPGKKSCCMLLLGIHFADRTLADFIFLSFYLSIFLSFHLSIFLSFYPSIFLSFYLSIFLSFNLSILPSFYLSIFLFFYLSILPSFYLSIFLSF